MTARVSFAGRTRASAIAVAWIVGFALIGGGVSWSLEQLPLRPDPSWWLAWGALTTVAGFGLATWVVGRVLERRSWEELGWRSRTGAPRGLALGLALGAGLATLAVALAVTAGHAAVLTRPGAASWSATALPLGVGFLLAALTEELMFRGYPLRRLAHALGPGPATALAAVCFGLAHLRNPSATALSTANVALAGVWLSCAFFSPGAMPLAWGAHFGWNATLALGFAAPVSGYTFPVPGIAYSPGPHDWIDGGAFGPEGGILTTLVLLAGVATLVAWSRRAAPRATLA